MAKKEATLLLKIKETGAKILDKLVITLTDVAGAAGFVKDKIVDLGRAMFDMAVNASKFREVQAAFKNLAQSQGQDADAMLKKMRELSSGTINDMELMKQANSAALLGLPVEKFGDMLQIARSSAKATGQSMDFMLQSIVTGLGRGSKLMLDNLGILIDTEGAYKKYAATLGKTSDALTDAEKKTAFINEALRIGKANAEAAGAGQLSLSDKWEAAKVRAENLANTVGTLLIPAMETFVDMASASIGVVSRIFGGEETSKIDLVKQQISEATDALEKLKAKKSDGGFFSFGNTDQAIKQQELYLQKLQEGLAREEALEKKAADKRVRIAQDVASKKKAIEQAEADEAQARLWEKHTQEFDAELAKNEALDEIKAAQKLKEQEEQILAQDSEFLYKQAHLDRMIAAETNLQKKMALMDQKEQIRKDALRLNEQNKESAFYQFKQFLRSQDASQLQSFLSFTSSLQNAKSKELVLLGKAAAMASISISTAKAAMDGYSWGMRFGGPPLAAAFAGLAIAAGSVQAAQVAGVQLAEGGIVQPRQGGVQATIAEAGQAEAVIPLEDSGSMLGGNTYVFNGPVMGDRSQAREFARMMDQELLELRRSNESVAFDKDFT